MMRQDSLPFHIITGFLGSGKTTLLKRLLEGQALGETALLINEFGDVGIDHLLVEEIAPDTVLLPSGCVCCAVRGDLRQALLDLHELRARGEVPAFRRVLLETTGLADPAPLRATILRDPQLRGRYRLGVQTTVVDAMHAALQEQVHPEWLAQVAAADRLLLSKLDLVEPAVATALQTRLAALNPGATVGRADAVSADDPAVLGQGVWGEQAEAEVQGWSLWQGREMRPAVSHGSAQVCCLAFDAPLDWTRFGVWLSLLLRCHGDRVLRVKGVLEVQDSDAVIAIHGVQHCLHAPVHLPRRPAGMTGSRLVLIVRGLEMAAVQRSLNVFLGVDGRRV
ncbi:GTP-binding protein [Pseudomonas sp. S 311-6]|nr:GTP-binding protein [Pseudomonas sp. S 311-6]